MKKKILLILRNLSFILISIPGTSWSSSNLDRQFKLESVGCLKAYDNVDDLFVTPVASACKNYFSNQNRFSFNDLAKTETLLKESKLPYIKIIEDPEILTQLATVSKNDTLIRSKIFKSKDRYKFTLDWIYSRDLLILSTIEFEMKEPDDGSALSAQSIQSELEKQIEKLIYQVPYLSYVSGKDNQSVVVMLGSQNLVKKNDVLSVGTLENVKKHPLLKAVVDWQVEPTGKLLVEQVEDGMAFCRVLPEENSKEINRFQKIIQVKTSPQNHLSQQDVQTSDTPNEVIDVTTPSPPRLGWIGLGLGVGSMGWNTTSNGGSTSFSGGGLLLGTQLESQIWLTQDWFTEFGLGYSTWNLSQKDLFTGSLSQASTNGGVSGSITQFKFSVGYSYQLSSSLTGPLGWIKLGYQSTAFSLPASTIELTGPLAINSVMVGVGGTLPLYRQWSLFADFNFKLFSSAAQSWYSANPSDVSDFELFLGASYQIQPRMILRSGFDYRATGVTFDDLANFSQKIITFHPTLLYYF